MPVQEKPENKEVNADVRMQRLKVLVHVTELREPGHRLHRSLAAR